MMSISDGWSAPYPPINQEGLVDSHDRPYAEFGSIGIKIEILDSLCQWIV